LKVYGIFIAGLGRKKAGWQLWHSN